MVPLAPPQPYTPEGDLRRVGVEIEFAGLSPVLAASLVVDLFGGKVVPVSPHRMLVEGTRWGKFTIELDSKYVHPDEAVIRQAEAVPGSVSASANQMRVELHTKTREWIGDMVAGLVPTEVVTPPVPWNELGELDCLFEALRKHNAKGTDASVFYGFGLHLNPQVPSEEPASILAHLRAYLILAAWLRDEIHIDITREVLPHANPFPKPYALKVLAAAYTPDLDTLIADYLEYNPTRNRELDMFPLFAHLVPDSSNPLLHEELVKPRPTFHYRLPNAQLSEPGWGAVNEWNRWVEVERLAADPSRLADQSRAYIVHHTQSSMTHWLDKLRRWMNE
ncbi:amidoligase family protein [Halomonas sp. WWR20]